jgi:hypothetical protein
MSYVPAPEFLQSLSFKPSQTSLPKGFSSEWERVQYRPWLKGGLIQHEYHVEKIATTNNGLTVLTVVNATEPSRGTEILFKGSLLNEDFFQLLLTAIGW